MQTVLSSPLEMLISAPNLCPQCFTHLEGHSPTTRKMFVDLLPAALPPLLVLLEAQSVSHWAAREVPLSPFLDLCVCVSGCICSFFLLKSQGKITPLSPQGPPRCVQSALCWESARRKPVLQPRTLACSASYSWVGDWPAGVGGG